MILDNLRGKKNQQCVKYSSIIGTCLIMLGNGFVYYWANMSVYCMSYFVSVLNSSSGVDSPWILSLNIAFFYTGFFASGMASKSCGSRMTIVIGCMVFDTGMFCNYFAIQSSLAALTVTMGVFMGVGSGIAYESALQILFGWNDSRLGLATGLLEGSVSLAGVLVNQLVTVVVNPRNLSPNLYLNPTKYFTQREVLDNIPVMFVILGCVSVCTQLLGFFMIRLKTDLKVDENPVFANMSESSPLVKYNIRHSHEIEIQRSTENLALNKELCPSKASRDRPEYTYKQMMKTKAFFAMWISFFFCGMPFVLANSYYKTFGQIWIKDDYFLTSISTIVNVTAMIISPLWGMGIDRCGVKNCQIAFMACTSLVLYFYYFTAMFNRWLFLIMTLLFGCLVNPLHSCFTAATTLIYGHKHFSTNVGIIMMSQLVFNLISPYFVGYVLTTLGWFTAYTGTGMLLTVSLLLIIIFMPNV